MISTLLLLVIGGAGMVALVLGMARRADVAVILILFSEVIATHYQLPTISLGSLSLFVTDLPTVALLAATVIRPYLGLRRRQASAALLAVFVLAALGLVRGVRIFGLQLAGNSGREILSFTAAALFFSTVVITPDFIMALRRWFTVAAAFIVAVGAIFWAQNGFGEFSSAGERGLRGLDALILLFATIIAIVYPFGRTRTQHLMAPAVGFIVLLLALQRSVAISGIVALIVIALFGGRRRTRRSSRVTRVLLVLGGLLVALLVLAGPTGLTSDLSTAVETSTAQEGTFSWRLEGWQILVGKQLSGSVPSVLVGEPAGTSNLRVIGDSVVTAAPHSEYVSLLQSVGVIGLAIMIWLLVSTIRRTVLAIRSEYEFTATLGLLFTALVAALVTYFISYSCAYAGAMILGLAVSFAWFGAEDPDADVAASTADGTSADGTSSVADGDEFAQIQGDGPEEHADRPGAEPREPAPAGSASRRSDRSSLDPLPVDRPELELPDLW